MLSTISKPTKIALMLSFYWLIRSGCYSAKTYCGASMSINFFINIDFHGIFPFLHLT
jgi:hypothetical protein